MRCEPKTSEMAASAGAEKLPSHSRVGGYAAQVVLLDLYAFRDLFLLLRAGLGEFLFDGELHFNLRIVSARDCERAGEGQRSFAGGALGGEFERVRAWSGLERYADQGEPCFCGGVVTEGELMGEPRAAEGCEFGRGFHLKQHWSTVDEACGLGMNSPGGGGDGERNCGQEGDIYHQE